MIIKSIESYVKRSLEKRLRIDENDSSKTDQADSKVQVNETSSGQVVNTEDAATYLRNILTESLNDLATNYTWPIDIASAKEHRDKIYVSRDMDGILAESTGFVRYLCGGQHAHILFISKGTKQLREAEYFEECIPEKNIPDLKMKVDVSSQLQVVSKVETLDDYTNFVDNTLKYLEEKYGHWTGIGKPSNIFKAIVVSESQKSKWYEKILVGTIK